MLPACLLDREAVREYETRIGAMGSAPARRSYGQDVTLRRWLAVWWSLDSVRLAPSTRLQYARQVRLRIDPYLGERLLRELDVAELAVWLDRLGSEGHAQLQVALSKTTLSTCLHAAAQRGLLPAGNPVPSLDPRPRSKLRRPRPLSPQQTEYLRLMLMTDDGRRGHPRRGLRSATLVSLLAYGGLRPSEAMGAKVGHVDPRWKGIWVSDVMSAEHRVYQTKTGEPRFVRLPVAALDDLALWIEVAGLKDPEGWLFPNRDGVVTPRTYPNWVNEVRRARVAIGLRRPEWRTEFDVLTPKTLRHSCGSCRVRTGEPVAEIAADMGHSVATLLHWYSHEVRASRDTPVEPFADQIERARREIASSAAARRLARIAGGPRKRRARRRSRSRAAAPTGLVLVGNRYAWDERISTLRRM